MGKYAITPALKDKNSYYEISSVGKSLQDKKTAAGDTEVQSINIGMNFDSPKKGMNFDSPIRQGGKKILKRENIHFNVNATSEQIQEEDYYLEGRMSDTNEQSY